MSGCSSLGRSGFTPAAVDSRRTHRGQSRRKAGAHQSVVSPDRARSARMRCLGSRRSARTSSGAFFTRSASSAARAARLRTSGCRRAQSTKGGAIVLLMTQPARGAEARCVGGRISATKLSGGRADHDLLQQGAIIPEALAAADELERGRNGADVVSEPLRRSDLPGGQSFDRDSTRRVVDSGAAPFRLGTAAFRSSR